MVVKGLIFNNVDFGRMICLERTDFWISIFLSKCGGLERTDPQ